MGCNACSSNGGGDQIASGEETKGRRMERRWHFALAGVMIVAGLALALL